MFFITLYLRNRVILALNGCACATYVQTERLLLIVLGQQAALRIYGTRYM